VIVKGLAPFQKASNPGALLLVIMVVITMMTDFRFCELMSKACAMANNFGADLGIMSAIV
jgi:hypothetical protein